MDDIKFKFDYDSDSNILEIEGTKELFGMNYVCSSWGSLHDINLEETLDRIRMSVQDKIISSPVDNAKK